ncbi:MAG TPA: SUMF1/EgtB/PvdO family nonheme iron enzyme [Acidobacteriota bacterium]|nr:SUMF1/EgtB/PvdO family nonheme iron enzyme [Acidobacteriota bacterium]
MTHVLEPEMVKIPAGTVTLGLPAYVSEYEVVHPWVEREVYVPSFAIARYPVTVGEYIAFLDATGYAGAEEIRTDPRFENPKAPAAFVSWIDAVRYTQYLSRETGKPYRLVRDAEWEKAARGGLHGMKYPWGNDSPKGRCDFGNPNGSPCPVGSFPPNGYGVHDMVGTIWEWCEECFDQVGAPDKAKLFYDDTQIKDPRLNPICRGGSFKTPDSPYLFCAYRHEDPVDGRFDCIGFRVALTLNE